MRRGSVGPKGGPNAEAKLDEVVLRTKSNVPPPVLGPGFMRRSCTFVTEGSWRKSSFGIGSGQKEVKDRQNLALQVRKKAAQLGDGIDEVPSAPVENGQGRGRGRVSRLVGNLKSWSSSEDVRQSVVGALTRTVNVIKQRPGSRKVQQADTKNTIRSSSSNNNNNNNNKKNVNAVPTSKLSVSSVPKSQLRPKGTNPSVSNAKGTVASNAKIVKNLPNKTPIPKKKSGPNIAACKAKADSTKNTIAGTANTKWLRHFQEAQASYNAREGRNRRPHPPPHLPDTDDSSTPTELRDVEDGVETENSDSLDTGANESASREKQDSLVDGSLNSTSGATPSAPQTPSSPETVSKKTESLRRKDMKIRQELQEKQNLIADILNIPRQDFESVADMAGEVGLSNKEPRELVLGAIYQAKKLQDSLNDAQTIRDSDIIASQAPPSDEGSAKGALPLYHIPMESMDKLVNISGALTQFLNSLMILISERDEERERMRKELVSSRERVHQLHMQQNIVAASPGSSQAVSASDTAPLLPNLEAAVASPPSSRPSSFMSANSSGADQSDNTDQHHTDEDGRSDDPSSTSEMKTKTETSLEKCEERSGEVVSAPTEAEESRVTRTEAEQEAGLGTT